MNIKFSVRIGFALLMCFAAPDLWAYNEGDAWYDYNLNDPDVISDSNGTHQEIHYDRRWQELVWAGWDNNTSYFNNSPRSQPWTYQNNQVNATGTTVSISITATAKIGVDFAESSESLTIGRDWSTQYQNWNIQSFTIQVPAYKFVWPTLTQNKMDVGINLRGAWVYSHNDGGGCNGYNPRYGCDSWAPQYKVYYWRDGYNFPRDQNGYSVWIGAANDGTPFTSWQISATYP